ncbi:MAG: DUF1800 domain-containing protein [Planctomycetes bacterium]|nr:DUF1800 domain-containing protein [Planctomycetota bacterium]MBI3843962.1 DUF1800 domain-containing protein [Planctomycetota bacterium]
MNRKSTFAFAWTLVASLLITAIAHATGLEATKNATWDRERAAHLLRRAGFGGSPREVDALVAVGRDKAVDSLVDFEKTPLNDPPYPRGETWRPPVGVEFRRLDGDARKDVGGYLRDLQTGHMQAVREWWLHRMVVTNRPLEEKMTLFWHGLFTSGFREVKSWQLLLDQNEFLRRNAVADFRTLVLGIAKDGAMLRYLDNDKNVKGEPNENFARELLELFTLGVGNYTEADVKEVARALTGWRVGPEGVILRPRLHDYGSKSILGKKGSLDVNDVVDVVLAQPAASRHLATKLWTFFAYEDPEPAIVDALATELRRTKFDVRAAMRTILRSDAFYSAHALHATIKSPVELIVGTLRALEISAADVRRLSIACRQMGQELFQPPNVKGWDGGRSWITTSTLFTRQNFGRAILAGERRVAGRGAMAMTMMRGGRRPLPSSLDGDDGKAMRAALEKLPMPPDSSKPQPTYDPLVVVNTLDLKSPRDIVRHFTTRLLGASLPKDREDTLVAALSPSEKPFDSHARDAAPRLRDVIHLILSLPEYQLN